MNIFESIVFGIVQGLTEFLPVSSSAHLRIVGEFLPGVGDPGAAFTAITQLGTEAAVIVYFWNDIVRIISAWWRSLFGRTEADDLDVRMGWLVIVATIPIGLLGVLFTNLIETKLRSMWIVAGMLIIFGLLLGIADMLGRRVKTYENLSWRDGILMGLAQALALIPGVSRSGGTITAGLALGYTRPVAARFSFLLAIPAVVTSGLYELVRGGTGSAAHSTPFVPTAIATVLAFIVGYLVIRVLLRYLDRGSFAPFVIYRVLLGGVLIVLLSLGVIQA